MTQYLSQLMLARLFAASLLLGFGFGLLYDCFRIRRLAFAPRGSIRADRKRRNRSAWLSNLLLHAEDVLFFVTAGVATAILYFAISKGQVRLMAIVGECAGFLLYRQTLGRLVMACADRIIRLIAWIIRMIGRFVILPPLRLLGRLAVTFGKCILRCRTHMAARRLDRIASRETVRYVDWMTRLAQSGFSDVSDGRCNKRRKANVKRKRYISKG